MGLFSNKNGGTAVLPAAPAAMPDPLKAAPVAAPAAPAAPRPAPAPSAPVVTAPPIAPHPNPGQSSERASYLSQLKV
ncbi:MAG: hypothetical protein JWP03_158, partial [Phycisphaerales bacterium]|nr:hypothetical protein [Phycisphaerales bacterium]